MHSHVVSHIRSCDVCQRSKSERQKRRGLLHPLPIPSRKWQSVSIDWISLPPCRGYTGCIVFTDRATKMIHACPTRNADESAEKTAEHFFREIVRYYGLPKSIVCDRDPRFTSQFWNELSNLCGIKLSRTAAYHPEANGQAERSNQTLRQILRVSTLEGSDWVSALIQAEIAMNNAAIHSSKYSPYYLNLGYHPAILSDVHNQNSLTNSTLESVSEFVTRMSADFEKAQAIISQHQDQIKAFADRHRRMDVFAPDDYVGVRVFPIARPALCPITHSLGPRWAGPFKITKQIAEDSYELDLPDTIAARFNRTFHASVLKKWHFRNPADPAAELSDLILPQYDEELPPVLAPEYEQFLAPNPIQEFAQPFANPQIPSLRRSNRIIRQPTHFRDYDMSSDSQVDPPTDPNPNSCSSSTRPISSSSTSTNLRDNNGQPLLRNPPLWSTYEYRAEDDVMLDPRIFHDACKQLKFKPSADMFASSEHHQLPRYYSLFPDKFAHGIDCFAHDWSLETPYANPPWPLIPAMLRKIKLHRMKAMVVVPTWPSSSWWLLFTQMNIRSVEYNQPIYLAHDGQLRPAPRWSTTIALVDGARKIALP